MSNFVTAAAEIARQAGALLLPYFQHPLQVEYKGDVDLVTNADRASEKFIVAQLRERFPDHSVIAEEGSGYSGASGYRWHIDPLDGTTNFAHGFPMFAVSIAVEEEDELIAGVVYDPTRQELFEAEKGGGARLNGKAIHVSSVSRLQEALTGTGFPSRKRHKNPNIHFYHEMNLRSHGVRRAGSAALDLAYVASGRLDGFWEFSLYSWDVAAGKLIVKEAGGSVTDMQGKPHRLDSPTIVASNGLLHEQMLQLFEEVSCGRPRIELPQLSSS